jgi:hypothetical protein
VPWDCRPINRPWRPGLSAKTNVITLLTHDLDDEAERWHQHRYSATCSLAFRFLDEILFISEMIGHIDPVLLLMPLVYANITSWQLHLICVTHPIKMRRYDIVSGIILILSIIDFALAAPVLMKEKRQERVDVVHIPIDVITVLGKR